MTLLPLFLPCAGGVETLLVDEVRGVLAGTGHEGAGVQAGHGGVMLQADWGAVLRLNLHSRLAQRVLVQLVRQPYQTEHDLYAMAREVPWEQWFTTRERFRIDLTAQHSPLKSLNFAALRIKDAVADRFRDRTGVRPDVDTQRPDVRIHLHLTASEATVAIDTSGEPLFKRGWRQDKGDAPLKETLAAAMLAACGWTHDCEDGLPLYDPCCGSGTIAIEAAQIACRIAPGLQRHFAFERLLPFERIAWAALHEQARAAQRAPVAPVHGSDVAFRMVDFAQRNAERAGVAHAVQLRGGDALQRMPPCERPGVILMNPPYGDRIAVAGVAGVSSRGAMQRGPAREQAQVGDGGDFFLQLAAHWKKHYPGWTAWVLTPDAKLPSRMRLKESRRVPMWNGPIECRLLRFDMVRGSARRGAGEAKPTPPGDPSV